jgi:hypothetical protein
MRASVPHSAKRVVVPTNVPFYNLGEVPMAIRVFSAFALLLVSTSSVTQTQPVAFDGVERWKDSLTPPAITSLKSLYSTDPPAKFAAKGQKPVPDIFLRSISGKSWFLPV